VTLGARPFRPSFVAAFLAVALLAFAGVRSTVMQAEMAAAPQALCGERAADSMPGMATEHAPADLAGKAHMKAQCDFCAAAHHAPLLASAAPLFVPAAARFTPAPGPASLGPRGPPAFDARARAPPIPV
jgi:hypothetical protein